MLFIGKVVQNPYIPLKNETSYVVYVKHTNLTPFYYLFYSFDPTQAIHPLSFDQIIINETFSKYVYNFTCNTDISYEVNVFYYSPKYKAQLNIFMFGCEIPAILFSHSCKGGLPSIFIGKL